MSNVSRLLLATLAISLFSLPAEVQGFWEGSAAANWWTERKQKPYREALQTQIDQFQLVDTTVARCLVTPTIADRPEMSECEVVSYNEIVQEYIDDGKILTDRYGYEVNLFLPGVNLNAAEDPTSMRLTYRSHWEVVNRKLRHQVHELDLQEIVDQALPIGLVEVKRTTERTIKDISQKTAHTPLIEGNIYTSHAELRSLYGAAYVHRNTCQRQRDRTVVRPEDYTGLEDRTRNAKICVVSGESDDWSICTNLPGQYYSIWKPIVVCDGQAVFSLKDGDEYIGSDEYDEATSLLVTKFPEKTVIQCGDRHIALSREALHGAIGPASDELSHAALKILVCNMFDLESVVAKFKKD